MLKNLAGLECKVENRVINLTCDSDCPLPHLKEALFQFQKYVGTIEDQVKAQQEQKAKEEADKEPPKEEVQPEGS